MCIVIAIYRVVIMLLKIDNFFISLQPAKHETFGYDDFDKCDNDDRSNSGSVS